MSSLCSIWANPPAAARASRRYSAQVPTQISSVEPVPRRQDPAVEQLLGSARGALNPVQILAAVEVLRALHDADGRVIHIRHQVPQEIGPRAEVGVQNDDVVARRAGERVLKVAGFLQVAPIRAHDVVKPELRGQFPDLAAIAVVENVHVDRACRPLHRFDMGVSVAQNRQVLAVRGKEDVDIRRRSRPALEKRTVCLR